MTKKIITFCFITIPFIFCANMVLAQNNDTLKTNETQIQNQVSNYVDTAPEYPGGIIELMKFIKKTMVYPPGAMRKGIEGKVMVRFTVTETGKVINPQIYQSSKNKLFDDEAIRIVNQMPLWKPGLMKGKNVSVWFMMPIEFKID